jgi:hypothetical protein
MLAMMATLAQGQTYAPFGYDSETLHLWHLDDTSTPAADVVTGSNNLPLQGLVGVAALSGTAISELATSLTCNAGATITGFLLAAPAADVDTTAEDVPFSFADPNTGAFTFEAVIKFNSSYNPTTVPGGRGGGTVPTMQILSMDGNGTTDRIFQFRYVGISGNPGNPTPPTLQFLNLINDGAVPGYTANVPITGNNAVNNTNWFHVAVTYNGQANTAGNLQFYWTKLVASNTNAILLSSTTMANDLQANAGGFTVGGRSRSGGTTDGFEGNIDEVRISGTARAATDMLLANTDSTGDGMPDWWKEEYFGTTAVSGSDDADSDGFTNLEEYLGGSSPVDGTSTPLTVQSASSTTTGSTTGGESDSGGSSNATSSVTQGSTGVVVNYTPIYDGTTAASSEYAYAGSSGINTISFICSNLMTLGNQQFIAYYGRHQTSTSYAFNNTIWIGRRTLGASVWQIFRTNFTPNDITDGHDVVVFGIDGAGYMHMSWGMHNATGTSNTTGFHYTKSTAPVTGTNNIAFAPDAHNMTGNEIEVTYPQFLTMPNGDMLYLYRVGGAGGGSGNGNTFWNHYSLTTGTWNNCSVNSGTAVPMINGESYSYNGYPNMPCMSPAGQLFLTWCWRYTPNYLTNENMAYAQSSDFGTTWQRSDGTSYDLGIAEKFVSGVTTDNNTLAQNTINIAQNSSLINQAGMCLDDEGVPVIATWWAPGSISTNTGSTGSGNNRRQYMVAFPTTTSTSSVWAVRQVSNRTLDATSFIDTNNTYVRDLGRPVPVVDAQGRVLVIYRDDHGSGGISVAYSQTRADDPTRSTWTTIDLSGDNLGGYEPTIDLQRWQRDNVLDLVYQPSAYTAMNGLTYSPPANTASQIGVLEWNEAAYFATPTLSVTLTGANALLSYKSILGSSYRLWTSTDLLNWTAINTEAGDGTVQSFTHSGGAAGPKRFWKLQIVEGTFSN